LADPFAELLAEELFDFLKKDMKNPVMRRAAGVRLTILWWRCRESNPGLPSPRRGFSERSR